MKRYYREQPQLDSGRVFANYTAAKERLRDNAFAGQRFGDFEEVRELQILKSPFSILFTHRDETIYVIDIRDQRGLRSHEALATFTQELRERYEL